MQSVDFFWLSGSQVTCLHPRIGGKLPSGYAGSDLLVIRFTGHVPRDNGSEVNSNPNVPAVTFVVIWFTGHVPSHNGSEVKLYPQCAGGEDFVIRFTSHVPGHNGGEVAFPAKCASGGETMT